MTCRLKNYTFGCQAVVLGELLKFTTEFKARSSLPARTHSVTCVLKRSGCRLPASSFLVKRSWRGTTEKVEDKNCQRRGAVARFAGLSARRQGAKEASSFRYFSTSFELFVTGDFHGSVWKPRETSTLTLQYGTSGQRAAKPPTGEIAFKRFGAVET